MIWTVDKGKYVENAMFFVFFFVYEKISIPLVSLNSAANHYSFRERDGMR